jgi:ABC-2 type transport system permease protein
MKKAFLVALREYVENLRTKTFWVGIAFFPFILILSVVVPKLLSDVKDVRHYAVLDRTGWLLADVERRSAMPDLKRVFDEVLELGPESAEAKELFPEVIRETAKNFEVQAAKMEGVSRDELLEQFVNILVASPFDKVAPEAMTEFQRKANEGLEKYRDAVNGWYRSLEPEEAERFGTALDRGDYVRREFEGEVTEDLLAKKLAAGEIFAYFVVGEDIIDSNEGSTYVSKNRTDEGLRNWFSRYAAKAVREKRFQKRQIAREDVAFIQQPVEFSREEIGEGGKRTAVGQEDVARDWAPVAFVYFLWISIFTIAQMLLTNTIEEKSNRIIEVLLSSISPVQLMTGKIAGIAATGLTIVSSWILVLFLGIRFVLPWMGSDLPFDLSFIVRDPVFLTSFLAYFLLGYLFYASLLCGIGAVCNSLKEAQNLMTPVTVLLMVPLFAMIPVAMDPNSTLAKFMSYIPPFTPFIMMNRAAGPPSVTEYVITTILLLVAIAFASWAAAKVFRVGILMTGKPPKLMEILRWIKAPVGSVEGK